MPPVIQKSRRNLLAARKQRFALQVYFYTGEYRIPSHPLLHAHRLCWQSTARAGSIVANH